jgi:anti-sigma regulatory factor (Ser/Thr protein kinase)
MGRREPRLPELPTRCRHGLRCELARAQHERFECGAFPADAFAPKRSRHLARLALAAWGLPKLGDAVMEVASELTTNAWRHGAAAGSKAVTRLDVRVFVEDGQFVFEVEDESPDAPTVKTLIEARNSGSGFGMNLVRDLADDWGTEFLVGKRKRVWAAWKL